MEESPAIWLPRSRQHCCFMGAQSTVSALFRPGMLRDAVEDCGSESWCPPTQSDDQGLVVGHASRRRLPHRIMAGASASSQSLRCRCRAFVSFRHASFIRAPLVGSLGLCARKGPAYSKRPDEGHSSGVLILSICSCSTTASCSVLCFLVIETCADHGGAASAPGNSGWPSAAPTSGSRFKFHQSAESDPICYDRYRVRCLSLDVMYNTAHVHQAIHYTIGSV